MPYPFRMYVRTTQQFIDNPKQQRLNIQFEPSNPDLAVAIAHAGQQQPYTQLYLFEHHVEIIPDCH